MIVTPSIILIFCVTAGFLLGGSDGCAVGILIGGGIHTAIKML